MPRNRRLGGSAEDRAAQYLQDAGYTLVTRNYHAPTAEIDIVAMDGDVLVFIEVKERKKGGLVMPEESLTQRKQRGLWLAAQHYLSEVVEKEVDARFDVIAVEGTSIRHHRDAFRPT